VMGTGHYHPIRAEFVGPLNGSVSRTMMPDALGKPIVEWFK
jgi:hypothetical protein